MRTCNMRSLAIFLIICLSGVRASLDATSRFMSKRDVNGSYIPSNAPYDNLFAGITTKEANSVSQFLDRQVNVTIPGDIVFTGSDEVWLLAPNKTDAIAYFEGRGPRPARFARALGVSNCFSREYMIGPLPINGTTKVIPLDYTNGGNATKESGHCDDDANGNRTIFGLTGENHMGGRLGKRNDLTRRSAYVPYEEQMGWSKEELPHDTKAAPITILPDGARHEFDPKQNYVSWMDFSFFVGTGRGGISLHDVHFKGERIIYELSMQEALAHYAGPSRNRTFESHLDVTTGFTAFNLIPGYDCPSYATYTDAFCLFEYPKDYPMNRHHKAKYYHTTKNIAFLLRSVSTVGNYDYQTTYEFYHDGSVQVLVRTSGYIEGDDDVNATDAGDYGFRIRQYLSGSMSDHVFNFKADLDVHGTKNSLMKTEFVSHAQAYPWSDRQVINTMKAERSFVESEDEAKINWAPNAAVAYSVVNKDKKNELGEYPGFRIYPSTGSSIHLTVQNSSVLGNQVNWATHQLYALQRKDSEPNSAFPLADANKEEPRVDFDRFFDGESLEQEDLVLYFNLGMHHLPDTYDLPTTVFQGSQSGITFRPQNYLSSDASLSSRQQVRIMNIRDRLDVTTYGAKEVSGAFDLNATHPPWYPVPEVDE